MKQTNQTPPEVDYHDDHRDKLDCERSRLQFQNIQQMQDFDSVYGFRLI